MVSIVDQNSFQFFFSNEAYVGQGIGLLFVHFLFIINPFAFIENYGIRGVQYKKGDYDQISMGDTKNFCLCCITTDKQ